MKSILRLLLVLLAPTSTGLFAAESWTLTSAPATNWAAISCSADGARLAAAAGGWKSSLTSYPPGPIYLSTNSGTTWSPSSAPTTNWSVMAMSADGKTLFGGLYQYFLPDPIYASADGGANWAPTASPATNDWVSLQCSADGQTAVATFPDYGHVPGGVFVSTNVGVAWRQALANFRPWPSVACSADGRLMVAATGFGYPAQFYSSVDSGTTWTDVYTTNVSGSVLLKFSADGTKLIGATPDGGIYISTNLAETWSATSAPNLGWGSLACSADAQTIIAAFGSHDGLNPEAAGPVYFSRDSGSTWTTATLASANWAGVAVSADGTKLFAADSNGAIYTLQTEPHPVLHLTVSGANVLVSWIIPSIHFVLQQSATLDGGWADVLTTPSINYTNLQYQVTQPKTAGTVFYRLIHLDLVTAVAGL